MLSTIVCGVEDSCHAGAVVAVARRLARDSDARLVVVHAVAEAVAPSAAIDGSAGPELVIGLRSDVPIVVAPSGMHEPRADRAFSGPSRDR